MVSKSQEQFWKHDVKVARDYNKTIVNDEGVSLKERLLKDLAQLRDTEFKSLITEAPSGFSNQQHTWSPMMKTNRTSRISIQELEKLYWNPTYTIAENRPTTFVKASCHYKYIYNNLIIFFQKTKSSRMPWEKCKPSKISPT